MKKITRIGLLTSFFILSLALSWILTDIFGKSKALYQAKKQVVPKSYTIPRLLKSDLPEHQLIDIRAIQIIPSAINERVPEINQPPLSNGLDSPEINYTSQDLYWLSKVVFAEAESEDDEGQVAIANVVLNRVKSDSFPSTIKEVISQKVNGVAQFSSTIDGRIHLKPDEKAISNAKKALEGEQTIPCDVLFFFADYVPENHWMWTRKPYKKIGTHIFTYAGAKE